MELFTNPNIASVLVERLPCAFAPTVNGKMGTHYAMVLLDKEDNVLYVGSECEHKHGEGVQALHDLGGDATLCYVATAAFKKALAALHASKQQIDIKADYPKDASLLKNYMRVTFNSVWEHACMKHNQRFVSSMFGNPGFEMRRQIAMQQTVDRVAASLLSLPPKDIDRGRFVPGGSITTPGFCVKQVPVYPEVFTCRCVSNQDTGVVYTLEFKNGVDTFARREGGAWVVNEDYIKQWAKEHFTVSTIPQPGKGPKKCLFCAEQFERMSKHTQGARHIDRVLEVTKLVCKATSRMGLRMLNNPRTRSTFIKR